MSGLAAADIFRTYVTPGVPESGHHKPKKQEIIGYLESRVESGALGRAIDVRTHGARGDDVADDTVPIKAAIAAAEEGGGALYFSPGTYKVTDALDCTNIMVFGAGAMLSLVKSYNATAAEPIFYLGRTCNVHDLGMEFDTSVMTGTETEGQRSAIITNSPASGYQLQRGSSISNVRIGRCGTGVYDGGAAAPSPFSVTFDTIEIENFSYRGWDFRTASRTGNVYSNIYVNGGDPATAGVDNTYATNQNVGFALDGHEVGASLDRINVEWMHGNSAFKLVGLSGANIGALHVEQFTQKGTYAPMLQWDKSSGRIASLSIYFCPINTAGWQAIRVFDSTETYGNYDPNVADYLEIGVLTAIGLNDGLRVASGNGIGALTDFFFVNREVAAVGDFRVNIKSYVWNTYQSDQAVYEAMPADPHARLFFEGDGPYLGALAITSNQNNFSGAWSSSRGVQRVTTDAARTITGYANGRRGKLLTVENTGSNPLILANENASSTAANRIITGLGTDLTISAGGSAQLLYDEVSLRWRVVGCSTTHATGRQIATVQGTAVALSNSSTAAQAIFAGANDTLTLPANTAYRFRAKIGLNTGATSHVTSFGFGGTATFTSISYLSKVISAPANTLATPQMRRTEAASATALAAASTAVTTDIWIEGILRTNGAGTIIPQITFSAGPTGICEVAINSFFELEPIGPDTVVAIGNWN